MTRDFFRSLYTSLQPKPNMTTKHEDFYAPLPPNPPTHQNYVVLPLYPFQTRNNRSLRRCLALSAAALLLLSAAALLLYPSDPTLTLSRLRLNKIQVLTSPRLSLSVSLSLTLRVFNRDFFSFRYSSLVVSVGYRGRELGFVTSDGGEIRARGSSYVNATLVLDGLEVVHDVVYLVEDLARGLIPFDTDSVVKGTVGIFFVDVPIKARVSCEVYVSTKNQTVTHQDCYPE
ncbi:uncharacterized protein LOC131320179 isoform X2 [Rhododendron vialii]|uniref:uncharacterized protein LOC131320179 isoform X2 n=1 Tax=Rhododendron vialii TaxID=182163 RepID=UPI00265EAEE3|nr:uncharacterized protein LOC131320179 isoform X2 [Rhododendron vialii]